MAANCSGTFGFYSRDEPLGSGQALTAAVQEFSAQPESPSLGEVTAAAGWTGEWDRMLTVYEGTDREALNAAAGLPDFCWPDLRPVNFDASHHPVFHVFVQGSTPRQAVLSSTSDTLFDVRSSTEVLYMDSVLEPVPPVPTRKGFLRPTG